MTHRKGTRFTQVVSALRLAAWAVLAVSCIYDADDRCGPNMSLSEVESCGCVSGYVLEGSVCVRCPEHETEKNGTCVCDEDYQRQSDGLPCMEVPAAGLGARCSGSEPCGAGAFEYCAEASNGDRYCTRAGCSSTEECDTGYACSAKMGGSFCQRSPLGLTSPCGSDADCAGTEATYCETLISKSCLVQGCSLALNDCFEGWDCCDVSSFGMPVPICVPEGDCPK